MKRFGIYGNARKPEIAKTVKELLAVLSPAECTISAELADAVPDRSVCAIATDTLELASKSDIIFSLGGDGTMLTAARAIMRTNPDAELIGINLGRLGFISEHSAELLQSIVTGCIDNTLLKEKRLLLEAIGTSEANEKTGVLIRRDILNPEREGERGDSARLMALNEIVLDNFGSTRMLTLEIRVQGSHLGTLRADGIIVSTPTGSTGYSVSAGGPLVEPTSQVLIISPIAAHSLSVRPVIVPDWYEVDIVVSNDANTPILVVADGQEEVVIESPAVIRISGHQNRLNLLRHPSQSYFDLLRTKLLWNADARGQRTSS
jgi:NAD+ kinase